MKQIISTLIVILLSMRVQAQTAHGYVKDTGGNPVSFANCVLLSSKDSSFLKGGMSDETGLFYLDNIKSGNYILEISCLGYKVLFEPVSVPGMGGRVDLGDIILHEESESLSEVTVTAKRLKVYNKGGNIVTDIANTSLKDAGSAKEVMKHIPGVMATGDKYEVLGKGSPVIYINNKKMRDDNELLALKSTEILRVEVIPNPGAEYDADTRAVVRITTRKKGG